NRLARTLVVGYGSELAPRSRDRRLLLAGAPQARRQGAESRGGTGRRKLDVGDEVVATTMTTPEVMSTTVTTPAAFGRHPSLRKEGRSCSCLFPSSHEEGRPRERAGWSGFPFVLALMLCASSDAAQAQSKCLDRKSTRLNSSHVS